MALSAVLFGALLAGCTALEMEVGAVAELSSAGALSVVATFAPGRAIEPTDAPEWCKNDTQLTWTQRRERMQQHSTLEWAKAEVKKLREEKKEIPTWMDKIVTDDQNRGKMKWATQEAKRLKEQGEKVPDWMAELAEENAKWANRWAACKLAEMKTAGEEAPKWMIDNAQKGIMEYADEKAKALQAQIEELEFEEQKENAIVQASGDITAANERIMAADKAFQTRSVTQQFQALEDAMEFVSQTELAFRDGSVKAPKMRNAVTRAKDQVDLLDHLLAKKLEDVEGRLLLAHTS